MSKNNEHYIDVLRFNSGQDSTVGALFLDGKFQCYTCEDAHKAVKVRGKTRVPPGVYSIKLRTANSPMNRRYSRKFGDAHKGMLWLQDVPNFTFIYLHIGNTHKHSEGCILVGYDATTDIDQRGGTVLRSTQAYAEMYKVVAGWIEAGKQVFISIHDDANPLTEI